MKDITILNNKDIHEIDELVHKALHESICDLDNALKIVDEAFYDLDCPWIKNCVTETVIKWFRDSRPVERDVYEWFRKNYSKYLGDNYVIVKRHINKNHKPDFWVSNSTETIPVECKLHDFNQKALEQLQRYMTVYNCNQGIAVASRLIVELPDNITFICFNESDLKE